MRMILPDGGCCVGNDEDLRPLREQLPSEWAGAAPLGGEVFWRPMPSEDGTVVTIGQLLFYHWCTGLQRWAIWHVSDHDLVSLEPIHLEPSLLWPCCGKHGYVRGGAWVDA